MLETSVLILHYNKNYEIELVLEAFLNQTVDKNSFEIVIADDGSDKSITPIVTDYIEKGLQINLLELEHTGNRALNKKTAADNAKGKYIIFYDSDMIPCRTFIAGHEKNLAKNEKTVSLGYRFLLNDFNHELISAQTIREDFNIIETMPCELDDRTAMVHSYTSNGLNIADAWQFAFGHTVALSKNFYNCIQGFDENFRNGWGAEDIEFGLQLYKAGAKFVYDESIKSYHIYHDSGSGKIDQYRKNLNYFYSKYKSYEPELFMLEYKMDSMSFYKLYSQVLNGKHLGVIHKDKILSEENCVFVGFKTTPDAINQNGNKLISTADENSDYFLVGSCCPYGDNQFEKAIISGSYCIFTDDYLYLVMKEAKRYAKAVYILDKELQELNQYWKIRTGYTFDEFESLKKVRVVITPNSAKRYDNVLYSELVTALNENNVYASLELAYDNFKDQKNIFPLNTRYSNKIDNCYKRNLRLISDDFISIIDDMPEGGSCSETNIWWGDYEYYGQKTASEGEQKYGFTKCILRNTENSCLKPGIRSSEINDYIKTNNRKSKGILVTDLYLENLDKIEELVNQVIAERELGIYQTVTIAVLPPIIDVYKVYKNTKYYIPDCMWKRALSWYDKDQNAFTKRIKKLIEIVADKEDIYFLQTNGSLEEMNQLIKENRIYLDLNNKRTFNPYVIQAAAFGLNVLTTSNIYESYGYPNIQVLNGKKMNAIYDLDDVFDSNWKIRPEMMFWKSEINVKEALSIINQQGNTAVSIETLTLINEKNNWSNILNNDFIKSL